MIHVATPDFDYSKISLSTPVSTTSGSYFTKINYTSAEESLYIYTPKCVTRTGVTTAGNKRFIDLSFTALNSAIIEWAQGLEEHLQHQIFAKRATWFTDELELDDIQNVFIPLVKPCKGGQYVLRAYVNQGRAKFPSLPQVYDSHETPLSLDDVQPEANIITILDLQGIKFTSRSFTIIVAVKQIMVLYDTEVFRQCMIKAGEPRPAPPAAEVVVLEEEAVVEALVEDELPPLPPPSEKELARRAALERARVFEEEAAEALRKAKELMDSLNLDA